MSLAGITFKKKDALKYQQCLIQEMIQQAESNLQSLQDMEVKQAAMKQIVADSLETWQPMADILKPMANTKLASKNVRYQQLLIEFLRCKEQAVSFLIANQANPMVRFCRKNNNSCDFSDVGQSTFQGNENH